MGNVYGKFTQGATSGTVDTVFVNPIRRPIEILYGHVIMNTNATVANRQLILEILDENDTFIYDVHAGDVVTNSLFNVHFAFMKSVPREEVFLGKNIQVPLGESFVLPVGWKMKIRWENVTGGDSYSSNFVFKEHQ